MAGGNSFGKCAAPSNRDSGGDVRSKPPIPKEKPNTVKPRFTVAEIHAKNRGR
jgi:hypothetical protein